MYSGYNTTSPDVNSIVQAYLARRPDIDPRYFSSFAEILQQSLSTIIQGVYGTAPSTATLDMINREVTNRAFVLLDNAVYQMQQRMQPQVYQQQMYQRKIHLIFYNQLLFVFLLSPKYYLCQYHFLF